MLLVIFIATTLLLANVLYQPCKVFKTRGCFQSTRPQEIVFQDKREGHALSNFFFAQELCANKTLGLLHSRFMGKMLISQGSVAFTEFDQEFHHEMLVHVPMAYLGDNVKALTLSDQYLGLGIAKQITKYTNRSVQVQMASPPDPHKIVQQFFSAINSTNPNVSAVNYNFATQDPSEDLQKENDLLILDSKWNVRTQTLPTQRYAQLLSLLKPEGILIVELGSGISEKESIAEHLQFFRQKLKECSLYQINKPTWVTGNFMFLFCSNSVYPLQTKITKPSFPTKYYTRDLHYASFMLSQAFKQKFNLPVVTNFEFFEKSQ